MTMNGEMAWGDGTSSSRAWRDGEYLTFALNGEEYGISIEKVKEVIGLMEITPIPGTQEYDLGVINLRGQLISVADLRLRFEMPRRDYDDRTCIIVVEGDGPGAERPQGLVVDCVCEVVSIKAAQIEEPKDFGASKAGGGILGKAMIGEAVKILLDIGRVLSEDEAPDIVRLDLD